MAKQDVEVKFSLIDGVSAGLRGIRDSFKGFGTDVVQLNQGFELVTKGIRGLQAVGDLFASPVQAAASFETALARVRAVTRSTDEQLVQLAIAAKEAGRATGFSSVEAAGGLEQLTRAGLSATEAAKALAPALQLAKGGALDVTTATNLLADTLDQFGLSGDKAASVADKIQGTAFNAGTSVAQLAEGFKAAAPAARLAGVSFDQTAAALALLAKEGIEGGDAGAALKKFFVDISDPTSKFRDELIKAGITTGDFATILTKVSGNSQLTEAALLGLSGKARPAIARLFAEGGGELQKFIAQLQGTAGASKEATDTINNTFEGVLTSLKNAFSNFQIDLGAGFLGPITAEFGRLRTAIDDFSKSPEFDELRTNLREIFVNGLVWVEQFVKEFDFSQLLTSIKEFATNAKTNFDDIRVSVTQVASGIKFAVDAMLTTFNAFDVGLSAIVAGAARGAQDLLKISDPFELVSTKALAALRAIQDEAENRTSRGIAKLQENFANLGKDIGATEGPLAGATGALHETAAAADAAAQKLVLTGDAGRTAAVGAEQVAQSTAQIAPASAAAAVQINELATRIATLYKSIQDAKASGNTNVLPELQGQLNEAKKNLADLESQSSKAGGVLTGNFTAATAAAGGTNTAIRDVVSGLGDVADAADKAQAAQGQAVVTASGAAQALADILNGVEAFYANISEGAAKLFRNTFALHAQSVNTLSAFLHDLGAADKFTNDAIQAQNEQAAKTAELFQEIAKKGTDAGSTVAGAFGQSEASLRKLAEQIDEGTSRFDLLDKARLDNLKGAAIAAADKIKAIGDAAKSAKDELQSLADSLQDTIDRNNNNESAIAKRNHDKQLAQIEELAKKGGAAAQAEADQARRNSDEAYKIELARIEATKQAKIKADNEVRANRDKPAGDTGSAGGGGSIVNTRQGGQQPQQQAPTVAINLANATLIGLDTQAGQDAVVRLLTPAFKRLGNLTR